MLDSAIPLRPSPGPPWSICIAVAFVYIFVLFGIGMHPALTLETPWFAPVAALGGVIFYAAILWLIESADPRVWHRQADAEAYLHRWAKQQALPIPDSAEVRRWREVARIEGGIILAQQGGAVAGAGAAVTVIFFSKIAAVVVFGIVMLTTGLVLRRLLIGNAEPISAPDRTDASA